MITSDGRMDRWHDSPYITERHSGFSTHLRACFSTLEGHASEISRLAFASLAV